MLDATVALCDCLPARISLSPPGGHALAGLPGRGRNAGLPPRVDHLAVTEPISHREHLKRADEIKQLEIREYDKDDAAGHTTQQLTTRAMAAMTKL
jgi:hypothetical protein